MAEVPFTVTRHPGTSWGMDIQPDGTISGVNPQSPCGLGGITAPAVITRIGSDWCKGNIQRIIGNIKACGDVLQICIIPLGAPGGAPQNPAAPEPMDWHMARAESFVADAVDGDENTFIMQRENPKDSWGMLVGEDGSVREVKDNSPAYVAGVPVQARITHTNGTATPTGSAFVQVLKSLPVTPNMVVRITAIVPEGAMKVESAKKTYNLERPSTSTSWGLGFTNTGVVTEVAPGGPAERAAVVKGARIVNVGGRSAENDGAFVAKTMNEGGLSVRLVVEVPMNLLGEQKAKEDEVAAQVALAGQAQAAAQAESALAATDTDADSKQAQLAAQLAEANAAGNTALAETLAAAQAKAAEEAAQRAALQAQIQQMNQMMERMRVEEAQRAEAARNAARQGQKLPPAYWHKQNMFPAPGFKKFPVTDQGMLQNFQNLVDATCRHATLGQGRDQVVKMKYNRLKVSKVHRIQNDRLWVAYATHRDLITPVRDYIQPITHTDPRSQWMKQCEFNYQTNECYLWHGTKPSIVDILCAEGFDERVCSLGGLFGAGAYFAEHISKSDQYCVPDHQGANGTYFIFLARVAMGKFYETTAARNNERRSPDGYDSVLGQIDRNKYREFIVYDGWQAYPEYILEYKRVWE